jgi:hypothetical protein
LIKKSASKIAAEIAMPSIILTPLASKLIFLAPALRHASPSPDTFQQSSGSKMPFGLSPTSTVAPASAKTRIAAYRKLGFVVTPHCGG